MEDVDHMQLDDYFVFDGLALWSLHTAVLISRIKARL